MGGTVPKVRDEDCRYGARVLGEKDVVDKPATLVWASRLLFLECAGLVALTVFLIVVTVTGSGGQVGVLVALSAFAALGAVAVFFVARAIGRAARGARGPAVVVQLFVIASGGFLIQVHPVWLGVLMMVLGALIGVLIVLPPSTRALGVD
jgi:hypothetical protein